MSLHKVKFWPQKKKPNFGRQWRRSVCGAVSLRFAVVLTDFQKSITSAEIQSIRDWAADTILIFGKLRVKTRSDRIQCRFDVGCSDVMCFRLGYIWIQSPKNHYIFSKSVGCLWSETGRQFGLCASPICEITRQIKVWIDQFWSFANMSLKTRLTNRQSDKGRI